MNKLDRVSQKLRDFAQGQRCELRLAGVCADDSEHETTVMCHLSINQRGVGMKVNDLFSIHACHACHDVLDGRTRAEIDAHDILRAFCATLHLRMKQGLVRVDGMKY